MAMRWLGHRRQPDGCHHCPRGVAMPTLSCGRETSHTTCRGGVAAEPRAVLRRVTGKTTAVHRRGEDRLCALLDRRPARLLRPFVVPRPRAVHLREMPPRPLDQLAYDVAQRRAERR